MPPIQTSCVCLVGTCPLDIFPGDVWYFVWGPVVNEMVVSCEEVLCQHFIVALIAIVDGAPCLPDDQVELTRVCCICALSMVWAGCCCSLQYLQWCCCGLLDVSGQSCLTLLAVEMLFVLLSVCLLRLVLNGLELLLVLLGSSLCDGLYCQPSVLKVVCSEFGLCVSFELVVGLCCLVEVVEVLVKSQH